MGKFAQKIVKVDLKKLIKLLSKALADEWLAYYQYWVGSLVAVGMMRNFVAGELAEHAKEEKEHADKLAERILQLGGTPLLKPSDWDKQGNCGYEVPKDPNTKTLLIQNVGGERCAIKVYKDIMEFTRGKDDITFRLALGIMRDEVEHEEELEAILEDMKVAKKTK